LHDSAQPHIADFTIKKNKSIGVQALLHPPFTSYLAPSDLHLFCSMEHYLRDKKNKSENEKKSALSDFFSSKTSAFYKKGVFDFSVR
jgi:[histone H3]-lysine36 N-dimethyltransferase SETMAR